MTEAEAKELYLSSLGELAQAHIAFGEELLRRQKAYSRIVDAKITLNGMYETPAYRELNHAQTVHGHTTEVLDVCTKHRKEMKR